MIEDNPFAYFLDTLRSNGLEAFGRYYSVYRGEVADNQDPEEQGRVLVKVPSLFGDDVLPDWAWPRAGVAGDGHGVFAVPTVGSRVWVSFEAGDPKMPVYDGGWWGKPDGENEAPEALREKDPKRYGVVLPGGTKLVVDTEEKTANTVVETESGKITVEIGKDEVVLKDSAGTKIVLRHGNQEQLEIRAASGAVMLLSEDGVSVQDAAGNKAEWKAGGVTVSSPAKVDVQAPSVKVGVGAFEPLVKFGTFSGWWAGVVAALLAHTHLIIKPIPGEPTSPMIGAVPPVVPGLGTTTVQGA